MKNQPRNNNDSNQESSVDQDRKLIAALKRCGFTVPKTDFDAHCFLAKLDVDPPILPDSLADTESVVNRILGEAIQFNPAVHDSLEDTEQVHSMKRAARNGTSITDEIEEAMRLARNIVEEKRECP